LKYNLGTAAPYRRTFRHVHAFHRGALKIWLQSGQRLCFAGPAL
jgi:hypothetical protein